MIGILLCFSGCSVVNSVKDRFLGGQSDNSMTELPGSTITVETAANAAQPEETVEPFLDEDEVELPEEGDVLGNDEASKEDGDASKESDDTEASDEQAASGDTDKKDETQADDAAAAENGETAETAEASAQSGEVTYEDVNETVYTTGSTYARNAPGEEGEVAKVIAAGTQIRRIGKGSDGWDKVDINGELYYMSSDALSTSAP
jgi:uncharacterized protein YgiM (DUF1202 family)